MAHRRHGGLIENYRAVAKVEGNGEQPLSQHM